MGFSWAAIKQRNQIDRDNMPEVANLVHTKHCNKTFAHPYRKLFVHTTVHGMRNAILLANQQYIEAIGFPIAGVLHHKIYASKLFRIGM